MVGTCRVDGIWSQAYALNCFGWHVVLTMVQSAVFKESPTSTDLAMIVADIVWQCPKTRRYAKIIVLVVELITALHAGSWQGQNQDKAPSLERLARWIRAWQFVGGQGLHLCRSREFCRNGKGHEGREKGQWGGGTALLHSTIRPSSRQKPWRYFLTPLNR
jgi:hypothetical protein